MSQITSVEAAVKVMGHAKVLNILNGYVDRVNRIRHASAKRTAILGAFKKMTPEQQSKLLS